MNGLHLQRRAFTLIEVMTAILIGGILCVLLFALVDRTLFSWGQTLGKMETHREARAALDQLADDFRSAVFDENKETFYGDFSDEEVRHDSLGFLIAKRGQWKGDWCFVRYALKWREARGNRGVGFDLIREFYLPFEVWPLLPRGEFHLLGGENDRKEEILAQNVFSFALEFFFRNEEGVLEKREWIHNPSHPWPDFVQICLEMIPSRETRYRLTKEQWDDLEGDPRMEIFYLMIPFAQKRDALQ